MHCKLNPQWFQCTIESFIIVCPFPLFLYAVSLLHPFDVFRPFGFPFHKHCDIYNAITKIVNTNESKLKCGAPQQIQMKHH